MRSPDAAFVAPVCSASGHDLRGLSLNGLMVNLTHRATQGRHRQAVLKEHDLRPCPNGSAL